MGDARSTLSCCQHGLIFRARSCLRTRLQQQELASTSYLAAGGALASAGGATAAEASGAAVGTAAAAVSAF
jgi:hypothetical protein